MTTAKKNVKNFILQGEYDKGYNGNIIQIIYPFSFNKMQA